jgi:hypothetical protein
MLCKTANWRWAMIDLASPARVMHENSLYF